VFTVPGSSSTYPPPNPKILVSILAIELRPELQQAESYNIKVRNMKADNATPRLNHGT